MRSHGTQVQKMRPEHRKFKRNESAKAEAQRRRKVRTEKYTQFAKASN